MKKNTLKKIILCLTIFPLISHGQSYYRDSVKDVALKKSIIQAILNEVNSNYLLSIENELWAGASFYRGVQPIENIDEIIDESSGFKSSEDVLVLDGDKIETYTGQRISDVPGNAVIAFDGFIEPSRDEDHEIMDGDKIWVETGKIFETIPKNTVIVYDCLFPPAFFCGARQEFVEYKTPETREPSTEKIIQPIRRTSVINTVVETPIETITPKVDLVFQQETRRVNPVSISPNPESIPKTEVSKRETRAPKWWSWLVSKPMIERIFYIVAFLFLLHLFVLVIFRKKPYY